LLYGADRVLDAPQTALRVFLSEAGIDYGTKVRCYLEGDTEYGALNAAVGRFGGIEFVNLRGQVAEKRGRGLAFRDSLRNDVQAHVFSFIIMDTDNGDYVRVVRKAADDDVICGRFFLSSPDFELANFSIPELCSIIVNLAKQRGMDSLSEAELLSAVTGASSGKEFFKRAVSKLPRLGVFQKSEEWGEALMNYALQNPHLRENVTRPVIEAAELIIRARTLKYLISREKFRVDARTGELVSRDK
jgi:hypothetical protein